MHFPPVPFFCFHLFYCLLECCSIQLSEINVIITWALEVWQYIIKHRFMLQIMTAGLTWPYKMGVKPSTHEMGLSSTDCLGCRWSLRHASLHIVDRAGKRLQVKYFTENLKEFQSYICINTHTHTHRLHRVHWVRSGHDAHGMWMGACLADCHRTRAYKKPSAA